MQYCTARCAAIGARFSLVQFGDRGWRLLHDPALGMLIQSPGGIVRDDLLSPVSVLDPGRMVLKLIPLVTAAKSARITGCFELVDQSIRKSLLDLGKVRIICNVVEFIRVIF